MKKIVAMMLASIALTVFVTDVFAHGRHSRSRFDFYFGTPLWWGPSPYYRHYPPYYYEPRTIIIEREPPVYIQRPTPAAPTTSAAPGASVWFYCAEPPGYYPYVQNCAQSWVLVDPRTVAPPPRQ